jgi:hypothetical protein
MDSLVFGMKANELAAIVFGIVGMVVALVGMVVALLSYQRAGRSERLAEESNRRSIESEKRAREIAYAQRRAELLGYITEGKVAQMALLRKLAAFRDAALEAHATEVGPQVEKLVPVPTASIAKLTEMEKDIQSIDAAGKSHEDLMRLMSSYVPGIRKLSDPQLIAEEFGKSFDQFERHIREVTLHREVAKQLGQSQ